RSISPATSGVGDNAERTSQQVARSRHVAFLHEFPHVAARQHSSSKLHRLVDDDVESQLFSELFQTFDVAFLLVSEMEVEAFVDFGRVQRRRKYFFREFKRRHHREIAREGKYE